MSRLVRWVFLVFAVATCALGGTSLAMLVAQRRLEQPNPNFAFAVDLLEHDGCGSLARVIAGAQSEVLISARQITSLALLEALNGAARRQVTVQILLDPGSNPDPGTGSLHYLLENHVGRVLIAPRPLYDQFLVVDGQTLLATAAPWSAAAAKDLASVWLLRHRGAGAIMRRHFELLAAGARAAGR